jgi:DNA (cytosine-5)-methyltransferase 1
VRTAVDLCAGSGWAVACQWLGISELGIEIMPEAIRTRDAMGALTQMTQNASGKVVGLDMTAVPDAFCGQADIQIAGPPCQTFSAAGGGEGRRALDEVLRRVHLFGATGEFVRGGSGDPRTWLVLEPLRLAIGGMPMFVVWEQVPSVLPVWEACGKVLRAAGYSVWTGFLHAEQYGVPQTRKRAFLIARRDGKPAAPPPVTHSKYHNRDPKRLDPGVLPWVSMTQALGWGTTGRNSVQWVQRSNYTGRGERSVPSPVEGSPPLGARQLDEPSATITSKAAKWAQTRPATTVLGDRDRAGGEPQFSAASIRVTVEEAAILQTFPPGHPFQGTAGKRYLQVGNAVPPLLAWHILRMFPPLKGLSP